MPRIQIEGEYTQFQGYRMDGIDIVSGELIEDSGSAHDADILIDTLTFFQGNKAIQFKQADHQDTPLRFTVKHRFIEKGTVTT